MSETPSETLSGWIRLRGLRIDGVRIGVYPHEQNLRRHVIVDLGLKTSIGHAAQTDRLADSIDYDIVARLASEVALSRHHNLIETLASEIASALLAHFPIERVAVEVHKPGVIGGSVASVALERGR